MDGRRRKVKRRKGRDRSKDGETKRQSGTENAIKTEREKGVKATRKVSGKGGEEEESRRERTRRRSPLNHFA